MAMRDIKTLSRLVLGALLADSTAIISHECNRMLTFWLFAKLWPRVTCGI
jgi:hypothetical protein